ncbi:F-box protein: endocytic membrane traffic, recycling ReCYcling 1 [Coemansia interrupta]|uniref:F-box protein: endocytic membrane traffic, recycling ReCYcling 1 n=1 Tax=Coemansia interrupta TaxID=1126814 RepID=A0A9W8LM98_9FUNG|nr:F-box protein: endocytic membrane traffic, recycling ReCYcling 1 [Coemansia interrupta]
MSDYEDESGVGSRSAAQMAKWLGLASPRELLDRTTKFVLNAAHGKSRSLIPTSDEGPHRTEHFGSTGVVDWEEEAEEEEEEAEAEEEESEHRRRAEGALAVLESEILQGRWNEYALMSDSGSDEGGAARTMRVDLRRRQQPGRRRRPAQQPHAVQLWRAAVGRVAFTRLPARVVVRILSYLPVDALLAVTGSCRVLRRVVHRHEPSSSSTDASSLVGGAAYTTLGLTLWWALLQRMGWRIWQERTPGHEPVQRVTAPRSHTRLLQELCGVSGASELASAVAMTPDLVFKAVFDELHADYAAFRRDAWAQVVRGAPSAWKVAERLDQLQWLGRAQLTADAERINRRVGMAAERLEHAYAGAFRRALVRGDTGRMRTCAGVLGHLGQGRACIGVMQAAALLASTPGLVQHARAAQDAPAFSAFLDRLHAAVEAHARAVCRALPPPWLPSAALTQFIRRLFAAGGAAHAAVQTVCSGLLAHGNDAEYLRGVGSVVARLLQAAERWAGLRPVGVDVREARRFVYAAFDGVILEYVARERRVVERLNAELLAGWAQRAGPAEAQSELARMVDFEQRQRQIDEYRGRVLRAMDEAPEGAGRTVVGELVRWAPVSIGTCLNMVLANREAVGRLAVFAEAPGDMRLGRLAAEAIESVFCILLHSIGSHVRPAFARIVAELKDIEQAAMSLMDAQASAQQPGHAAQASGVDSALRTRFASASLRFLELIHLADLAVQLVELHYTRALVGGGFVSPSDFLSTCNQEKRGLERAIDDLVAVGMDSVIDVIVQQTEHILQTRQQASDYFPPTSVSLKLTPTLACTHAVHFLTESTLGLRQMTAQRSLRLVCLGEVGERMFHVLVRNIRRFRVSEPGGFQLIADLNLYYDWALANVDAETLRFFAALKDLANCFILPPNELRGFLREQYSRRTFDGVMRSEEVYDVVACRADYREIRGQVEGHCDFM